MHTIRLRGPWEFHVLADEALPAANAADLPSGTVKMPSDGRKILGHDFRGRVRYSRKFNRPTGLEGGARVTLAITAIGRAADISLNGQTLGPMRGDPVDQRFEVTKLLQPSNQLAITIEQPFDLDHASHSIPTTSGLASTTNSPILEVRLEILD